MVGLIEALMVRIHERTEIRVLCKAMRRRLNLTAILLTWDVSWLRSMAYHLLLRRQTFR